MKLYKVRKVRTTQKTVEKQEKREYIVIKIKYFNNNIIFRWLLTGYVAVGVLTAEDKINKLFNVGTAFNKVYYDWIRQYILDFIEGSNQMKKLILALISVGIFTLVLIGCTEEDRDVLSSGQGSIQLSTAGLSPAKHEASRRNDQITMELPQQTYPMDTDRISLTIRNLGTKAVSYGAGDITVEVEKDGVWYLLPYVRGELDIRNIPPGYDSQEIVSLQYQEPDDTINGTVPEVETQSYDYRPGHYRIGFETPEMGWASAEFDLVE